MGLKSLLTKLTHPAGITIDEKLSSEAGLLIIVDIKGSPVDPSLVFNEKGAINPGYVPTQWAPPTLIIYTPEQLPVSFEAVRFV